MKQAPALWALAVVLCTASSGATEGYPATLESHLKLTYRPDCSVCHLGGKTGGGTVITPFGRAARARGLPAEDPKVLVAVLERMRGERLDSDADGVPDIDELVSGTDPNLPPNDTIGMESYGCVGRIAPGQHTDGFGALAGFGVAAWLFSLRQRRRRLGLGRGGHGERTTRDAGRMILHSPACAGRPVRRPPRLVRRAHHPVRRAHRPVRRAHRPMRRAHRPVAQGAPPRAQGTPPRTQAAPPGTQAAPPGTQGAPPRAQGAPPGTSGAPPVRRPHRPWAGRTVRAQAAPPGTSGAPPVRRPHHPVSQKSASKGIR